MACFKVVKALFCIIISFSHSTSCYKLSKNDEKCPEVRARSNCDLDAIKGAWNVIEYYASSEEVEIYRCMRSTFNLSPDTPEISMDFTYSYADDPDNEMLTGNITWNIPSFEFPGHWVHMETPYEGVYNTFVLDCKDTWAVLLHCAEKPSSPRYLSSILLSRERTVPVNVLSYVHDKLPKYGVQLEYTFPMVQDDCSPAVIPLYYGTKTVAASDKQTGAVCSVLRTRTVTLAAAVWNDRDDSAEARRSLEAVHLIIDMCSDCNDIISRTTDSCRGMDRGYPMNYTKPLRFNKISGKTIFLLFLFM